MFLDTIHNMLTHPTTVALLGGERPAAAPRRAALYSDLESFPYGAYAVPGTAEHAAAAGMFRRTFIPMPGHENEAAVAAAAPSFSVDTRVDHWRGGSPASRHARNWATAPAPWERGVAALLTHVHRECGSFAGRLWVAGRGPRHVIAVANGGLVSVLTNDGEHVSPASTYYGTGLAPVLATVTASRLRRLAIDDTPEHIALVRGPDGRKTVNDRPTAEAVARVNLALGRHAGETWGPDLGPLCRRNRRSGRAPARST